jgi:predicted metalloprotease with PDZ domain
LNYGTIQLANWQEILFDCDVDVKLNIEFEKDAQHYDLGVKRLSEWKVSPSKILPTKTLVNVNRINVACNLSSKELQTQIEQTLKPFNYLAKGTDVVIIFANDSMASGGIRYPNLSIVYIDAKTSDSNPKFALQHTLLHELFHSIIPYEINPEEDAEAILENWLAEAVPEYFSLRCLLKNGLITESEFITQMEQKLRTAVKFDGKSLQDMSLNIYRNATYYEAFYSKGCIALFLADLDLYRASKGEFTISDLIIGKFPDLNEEQQAFITQVMYDLEQAIVVNPNSFALNKYLEAYGWLYQKQVVLPYKVGSKTAEIRKENIVMNKTANIEQKSLWEGFIHR